MRRTDLLTPVGLCLNIRALMKELPIEEQVSLNRHYATAASIVELHANNLIVPVMPSHKWLADLYEAVIREVNRRHVRAEQCCYTVDDDCGLIGVITVR